MLKFGHKLPFIQQVIRLLSSKKNMAVPMSLSKDASSKDLSLNEVLFRLRERGLNFRKIAKLHGRSTNTIRQACVAPFPLSEARIAQALQVHPKEIWPSRYSADGSPLKQGIREKAAAAKALKKSGKHFVGSAHKLNGN